MKNDDFWLQRAIFKLNQLHMNGSSFKEELWELEWDPSVSKEENFSNSGKYELALETLIQAKVVHADFIPNREGDDPSIYLYYVNGFDYDRFLHFCETYGFKITDRAAQPADGKIKNTHKSMPPTSPASTLTPYKFEPRHYNQRTGILTLSPTDILPLAASGKVKRPDGEKYLQCLVMEKVFRSVNTIRNGVDFKTILGVNDAKITKKMETKIRNTVTEINKKVTSVGGPKKLIKVQNKKVFVNNSYL